MMKLLSKMSKYFTTTEDEDEEDGDVKDEKEEDEEEDLWITLQKKEFLDVVTSLWPDLSKEGTCISSSSLTELSLNVVG